MSRASEILNQLNERNYTDWKSAAANDDTLDEEPVVKVTFKDVLDAKERYEQQIKDTTWLIERIKVYGSKEMQQRAYDNVTAQLKAMDSFLEGLYKETIGEA